MFHRRGDQAGPEPRAALDAAALDAAGRETADRETAASEIPGPEAAAAAELLDRTVGEDWGLLLPSAQAVHDRRRALRRGRRMRTGLVIAAVAGITLVTAPLVRASRSAVSSTATSGRTGVTAVPGAADVTGAPTPLGTSGGRAAAGPAHGGAVLATPTSGAPNPGLGAFDPATVAAFAHGTVVGSGTAGGHSWQVRVVVYDQPGEMPASIEQQFFFGTGDPVTADHPVAFFGGYDAGVLTSVRMSAPPAYDIPVIDLATAADISWADEGSAAVFSLPIGTDTASVSVTSHTSSQTFFTIDVRGYRFVSLVLLVTTDEQIVARDFHGTVLRQKDVAARPPL